MAKQDEEKLSCFPRTHHYWRLWTDSIIKIQQLKAIILITKVNSFNSSSNRTKKRKAHHPQATMLYFFMLNIWMYGWWKRKLYQRMLSTKTFFFICIFSCKRKRSFKSSEELIFFQRNMWFSMYRSAARGGDVEKEKSLKISFSHQDRRELQIFDTKISVRKKVSKS